MSWIYNSRGLFPNTGLMLMAYNDKSTRGTTKGVILQNPELVILPLLYYFLHAIGTALIFRRVNIPIWKAFVPILAWQELVQLSGVKEPWTSSYLLFYRQIYVYNYIFDGFGMVRQSGPFFQIFIFLCIPLYLIMAGLSGRNYIPMGQRENFTTQRIKMRQNRRLSEL